MDLSVPFYKNSGHDEIEIRMSGISGNKNEKKISFFNWIEAESKKTWYFSR